ncbi:MAG TPA: TonB-dependent receptor [Allosphingosinicella sp.]|jgi:outer membrane receptor protein involved in Fe transport
MKKTSLLGTSAICSAAVAALSFAAATPAYAQTTGTGATDATSNQDVEEQGPLTSEAEIESGANANAGAQGDDASEGQAITVTGSRIRRPNLESAIPITSVGGEEFFQQGQTSVGDTLNDLPQLRSTFAQQNPGAGVGIAGLNLLDLRGLGTVRTLVLVNGRRHVAADILNNATSPDVNTIPNDLIERVDIVTGGNSAVYGSDAIAGVVNFILRRDFDGIQVRGSAAISERGFGANQYASILAGKNFAGGRGNITLHAEYARQERIYASDIDNFRRVDGLVTVDVDSAGTPNASDGFPDAIFARDIRSSTNSRFGLVALPQSSVNAQCGQGTLSNNGPANTSGTPFNCNFLFNSDGTLVAQTGTRFGSGPTGTIVGGNGPTGREGTLLSILPSNERMNFNALTHYEFTKAFEVFAEAKFVRVNAVGNQLGPTFLNNTFASLGSDVRLNPRLDNPFLATSARTTIANAILGTTCTFTAGGGLGQGCTDQRPNQPGATPAQEAARAAALAARNAAIANGSYRFQFARTLADLPDRDEVFQRDTFRIVGGVRGEFNNDWNYELSVNYGKMKETAEMLGFVNRQRFVLSLDAARNPVTGQIQCRSQFDPAAATGLPGAAFTASLAADIAACVPYNPFGANDNSAAAEYFRADIVNRASLDQLNVVGFVNGDSSQLFELPGGPLRFALGAEYRREKAFNNSDEDADTGITNSVFLGDVNAKALEVKEAFGEIQIPLFKDMPFFHELTVSAAGRVSDYNNAAGTIFAYNAGVEWAPIRDLRLRANYGRSVRAPASSETSFPAVNNFANAFIDPCSINAIGANAIRSANCQAQLTAAQLANLQPGGYSLGVVSGSNANLSEETADSYTIGGVFTPRFLPGFSLSVDYYDITVNNVIVSLAAQTIINSCYDSPSLSSPLCTGFQRNFTAGTVDGKLPGQILDYTTVQGPQNFASRKRRGVDVEAAYRTNLGSDMRLSSRIIYSHQLQNSNFQDPTRPDFENRLLSELGDPVDEFRFNLDVTKGPVTLGYEARYLGKMVTSTYENFFPLDSACSAAVPPVCPPLNADAIEPRFYPAVVYHDLRLDIAVKKGSEGDRDLNFYVGVDNIFDKQPPLGTTATGAGSAIYNIRGRNYYAGFRARF